MDQTAEKRPEPVQFQDVPGAPRPPKETRKDVSPVLFDDWAAI